MMIILFFFHNIITVFELHLTFNSVTKCSFNLSTALNFCAGFKMAK